MCMDPVYGLEHMGRACVSRKLLERRLRMGRLERRDLVYGRYVRMDLVCELRVGIGVVVVAADTDRCSRFEHMLRRILLDYYLFVSSSIRNVGSNLHCSGGYPVSTPPPPAPNPASPASVIILSLGRLANPAGGYPYPTL